jgi:hypothetical protein
MTDGKPKDKSNDIREILDYFLIDGELVVMTLWLEGCVEGKDVYYTNLDGEHIKKKDTCFINIHVGSLGLHEVEADYQFGQATLKLKA